MRKWTRSFYGVIFILLFVTSGRMRFISPAIAQSSAPAAKDALPIFEKDMAWPKPLPNSYYIGSVSGLSVDTSDNIWVAQRPAGEKSDSPQREAARIALWKKHPG